MGTQGLTVVIGAGVIGCAVAYALSREGHSVLLLDRAQPGYGGASFGNVGHIAAELVEPLPSPQLLFGFWRELFALDGPLDIPLSRLTPIAPWAARFARAAWRQRDNTRHLAPLVTPSASLHEAWLKEIGRPDLLRRNGHFEIWLQAGSASKARERAQAMSRLGIPTEPMSRELSENARRAANVPEASGLRFPDSAHVVDPVQIAQAYARAAAARGAQIAVAEVRALRAVNDAIEVVTERETLQAHAVVICAGAWAAPLLRPFGVHAPLEAAYGYHVELQGESALADAPILYVDRKLLVTPMTGRLRCSSYMEFAGLDSPPDPRKPTRLRAKVRELGYACEPDGPSWRGARPVLPDYLPGIGRAKGHPRVLYAVGHQHIGLTIAPVTGELIADLVADRTPRLGIGAFDLTRFGSPPH
jgi:glycine/D-amino acid oxidase-like deaminating enzyme